MQEQNKMALLQHAANYSVDEHSRDPLHRKHTTTTAGMFAILL